MLFKQQQLKYNKTWIANHREKDEKPEWPNNLELVGRIKVKMQNNEYIVQYTITDLKAMPHMRYVTEMNNSKEYRIQFDFYEYIRS